MWSEWSHASNSCSERRYLHIHSTNRSYTHTHTHCKINCLALRHWYVVPLAFRLLTSDVLDRWTIWHKIQNTCTCLQDKLKDIRSYASYMYMRMYIVHVGPHHQYTCTTVYTNHTRTVQSSVCKLQLFHMYPEAITCTCVHTYVHVHGRLTHSTVQMQRYNTALCLHTIPAQTQRLTMYMYLHVHCMVPICCL